MINPVKHKLVKTAAEWPYSSIHDYIKLGLLPKNWGGDSVAGCFGEIGDKSRLARKR